MEPCYYFGCGDEPGHYIFAPGLRSARPLPKNWPFGRIGERLDGVFAPVDSEKMGRAALHVFHGWTVLAMWDRTVDKRGECNSNFIAHGRHSYMDMVALAETHFPSVWKRINDAVPVDLVTDV